MELTLTDFLTGLGLAMLIESLPYSLFPAQTRKMMAQVTTMPPEALRTMGLILMLMGVMTVWFVNS